jgi:predicted RNase H-like HicB family nuclease
MKNKKDLDYFLNLPWTYTIEKEFFEGKWYYIIRVNELPGICTHDEDLNEGMKGIGEAIQCAIEIYQEKGEPIPEPIDKNQYKGRISYRTDSKRHWLIARAAKLRRKSINKTLDDIVDAELQKYSFS